VSEQPPGPEAMRRALAFREALGERLAPLGLRLVSANATTSSGRFGWVVATFDAANVLSAETVWLDAEHARAPHAAATAEHVAQQVSAARLVRGRTKGRRR
jgi:hypothetical protein